MATRELVLQNNVNGDANPTYETEVPLALSDDTTIIDIREYNKVKIWAVTSAFGTGNITVTAQTGPNKTNFTTLDTAETITADGTVLVGGSTQPLSISTDNYLKLIRGADANVGLVKIILTLSKV